MCLGCGMDLILNFFLVLEEEIFRGKFCLVVLRGLRLD